jgi:hypothetical protein
MGPPVSQDLPGHAMSKCFVLVKQTNDLVLLEPIEFGRNPE